MEGEHEKGVAREIDSWNLDLTQFIGETKIGPVSTFFRSIRSSDKESCEVFIRNISIDVTLHKTRSYSVDRQEHRPLFRSREASAEEWPRRSPRMATENDSVRV